MRASRVVSAYSSGTFSLAEERKQRVFVPQPPSAAPFLAFLAQQLLPLLDQPEGVQRRRLIEVHLSNVFQEGVVGGAEQRELDVAGAAVLGAAGDLGAAFGVEVLFLQLGQDVFGSLDS